MTARPNFDEIVSVTIRNLEGRGWRFAPDAKDKTLRAIGSLWKPTWHPKALVNLVSNTLHDSRINEKETQ